MKKIWYIAITLFCSPIPASAQYTGLNSGAMASGFCATAGCAFAGLVTVAPQGVTSPTGANLIMTSGGAANPFVFKAGPNGAGSIILELGGSANNIAPQTNIALPGGAWGSGTLTNNMAPLFQNTTFSGSTTSAAASFGAFLQQSDNSINTTNGIGFEEHLILAGPNVVGQRLAGVSILDINSTTGNTSGEDYVGMTSKCNLNATDASGSSSCFGSNPVSSVGANVTAGQNVGEEVDTWEQSGAVVTDRIGEQIVDVMGSTYGTQASRDDMALSFNNQYPPSSTMGFKVGPSFGRSGGQFPVSTGGTLINAQGNLGSTFTVSKGIDWHLGIFTGNSWNDGHTILTGGGEVIVSKIADPGTAPGAGAVKLTAEAGTNPGTCKIVVRAGSSSTATTLLDNIGASC
jgi:hypothetical protein